MVPRVGVEPTRCHHHRILNPARLPIPPPRHRRSLYQRKLVIQWQNSFYFRVYVIYISRTGFFLVIKQSFGIYMKNRLLNLSLTILLLMTSNVWATVCPDPNNSSLQWGVVPAPWVVDPFSDNRPQGEVDARFIRANILVAGLGRGVVCNYRNSVGYYSIWWEVGVKIPARTDYYWIESLAGFECSHSINACIFYTA